MKIITCASYYGSGSSALTDLTAEYDNVKDLSNFEFRFLHDLDGVSDLEFYLTECHNRHNSGHALKRFMKLCKFNEGNFMSARYSQFFDNDDYQRITKDYINALIDFQYTGWWFYDLYDKGPKVYYLYQLFNHLFRKFFDNKICILKNEKTYASHPNKSKFLEETRNYVSNLMCALNKENREYLEIDQIVPSSNMERVLRYFNDEIFVFVIDRDPRDIYTLEKYYWKERVCPSNDVELFCKWYKYAREAGIGLPSNNSRVVKLQFEDLVFNYENSVNMIEKVTGLQANNHGRKFNKFNPKRSVNNTRVWEKHNDREEIEFIEKQLETYLYPFDAVRENSILGIEVKEKESF